MENVLSFFSWRDARDPEPLSVSLDHKENCFSLINGEMILNSGVVKTVISFASAYFLFGPVTAIICIVADKLFDLFDYQRDVGSAWFSSHFFSDAKEGAKFYFPIVILNGIIIFLSRLFQIKFIPDQEVAKYIQKALCAGWKNASYAIYAAAIRAPIVEEIFFRGFVQESIKKIQGKVLRWNENSNIQKYLRIFLQAIAFGLAHISKLHSLYFNILLVSVISAGAIYMGNFKEVQGSLGGSMALHSVHNSTQIAKLYFLA